MSAPSALSVTERPATGESTVPPSGQGALTLTVHAGSSTPAGSYTVPVSLSAKGMALPGLALTVVVT